MSSQISPISSLQKNLKMCKYISIFSFPFHFLICTILISVFCNHYNVFYQGCQRPSYWPINWFLFVVTIEYFLELYLRLTTPFFLKYFLLLDFLTLHFMSFLSTPWLFLPSLLCWIYSSTFSLNAGVFSPWYQQHFSKRFHLVPWLHTDAFQNYVLALESPLISRLLYLCTQLLFEVSAWNLIVTSNVAYPNWNNSPQTCFFSILRKCHHKPDAQSKSLNVT